MARVTVEDCLENVDNRFQLVLVATKRARQLSLGSEPMIEAGKDKPTVLALREIAEGLVTREILEEPAEAEVLEFTEIESSEESVEAAEGVEVINEGSSEDLDLLAAALQAEITASVEAKEVTAEEVVADVEESSDEVAEKAAE